MGNDSYIVDLRGFKVSTEVRTYKDESTFLMLDLALGEGRHRLDEIEDENEREKMCKIFDKIEALDDGIEAVISDQCMGAGPLAIGWSDFSQATPEKMAALEKIMKDAGFDVEPLEKDRFVTYG